MTNKRKPANIAWRDEQFPTQLEMRLTGSVGKKGGYGDYLRLLEFYRETRNAQARELSFAGRQRRPLD
jgi:hypothetical protein